MQEYTLWLLWQSTDLASKVAIARARCAQLIVAVCQSGMLSPVAQEHAAAVLCGLTSEVRAHVASEPLHVSHALRVRM